MHVICFTGVIIIRDGRGHEDSQAFTLPLEGGDPSMSAKSKTGNKQRTIELVNNTLIILPVLNPSDLQQCNLSCVTIQHIQCNDTKILSISENVDN